MPVRWNGRTPDAEAILGLLGGRRHGVLYGWKQIAAYLDRDIRTVYRWRDLGLPVHQHSLKGRIVAYAVELDEWLSSQEVPLRPIPKTQPTLPPDSVVNGSEWLSVRDAARLVALSERTIRHWIEQGALAATRVGPRVWRIKYSDLATLLRKSGR